MTAFVLQGNICIIKCPCLSCSTGQQIYALSSYQCTLQTAYIFLIYHIILATLFSSYPYQHEPLKNWFCSSTNCIKACNGYLLYGILNFSTAANMRPVQEFSAQAIESTPRTGPAFTSATLAWTQTQAEFLWACIWPPRAIKLLWAATWHFCPDKNLRENTCRQFVRGTDSFHL